MKSIRKVRSKRLFPKNKLSTIEEKEELYSDFSSEPQHREELCNDISIIMVWNELQEQEYSIEDCIPAEK